VAYRGDAYFFLALSLHNVRPEKKGGRMGEGGGRGGGGKVFKYKGGFACSMSLSAYDSMKRRIT